VTSGGSEQRWPTLNSWEKGEGEEEEEEKDTIQHTLAKYNQHFSYDRWDTDSAVTKCVLHDNCKS